MAKEAGQGLLTAATSYMKGDMSGVMSGVSSLFKTASGSNKKAEDYAKQTRTSPADVVSAFHIIKLLLILILLTDQL